MVRQAHQPWFDKLVEATSLCKHAPSTGSGSGGAGIVEAISLCKRPFDWAQGAGIVEATSLCKCPFDWARWFDRLTNRGVGGLTNRGATGSPTD